ncbi:MAG: NmrA/HSCARG family protein [Nitrosopumilus sp.]
MTDALKILVIGATGQQGGALARVLLSKGHHVRALIRKSDSPAAQELKKIGAELATGNFEDGNSLVSAAQGMDVVYGMTNFVEKGLEAETQQGIAIANAAKSAGVNHLVFASVSDANRHTGIPHFESKYLIEQHIKTLDIPHAIIAPVYFMDNLVGPWMLPGLKQGSLAMAMPAQRKLQQIPLQDIAAFEALVIEHRDKFLGKRIDIASDELDGTTTAEILSKVSGHKIEYAEVPIETVLVENEGLGKAFDWLNSVGNSAVISTLRQDYPEVGWHSFEDWAKAQDWSILN